uniref:Uncharacterized protein n=1 Tax=Klebsiella pneumoniae TaxID=573 RepID=A0A8B0STM6_KLEPN|nr:hypothetical protein [Klebsiella pneumoniae]
MLSTGYWQPRLLCTMRQKLAHLSKYYIRCSVFCIKSHPRFSLLFKQFRTTFSVTLSPAPAAGDYTALQFLPADRQAIAECLR